MMVRQLYSACHYISTKDRRIQVGHLQQLDVGSVVEQGFNDRNRSGNEDGIDNPSQQGEERAVYRLHGKEAVAERLEGDGKGEVYYAELHSSRENGSPHHALASAMGADNPAEQGIDDNRQAVIEHDSNQR